MMRFPQLHRPGAFAAFPLTLALSLLSWTPQGRAMAAAPYPKSQVITGMSWDRSTVTSLRKAHGSDLWPLTWAADGNLYGAWGDGGGFNGDSNYVGRVSLGFARITGTPMAGAPSSFAGENVWGRAPDYAEHPATFGGKIDDLISINGILYGHGGLWTSQNCSCADPTLKSGDNPTQRQLAWSSDLGKTWTIAPWTTTADLGGSLQFGPDYRGAFDPNHVYLYYQGNIATDHTHLYLRRVPISRITEDPRVPGHYEYWVGPDNSSTPTWSTLESNAAPVFTDLNIPVGSYAGAAVAYDAPLGRYLLTTFHGNDTGQIGFFEAPHPWGPWATIEYDDDWGHFNEIAGEGNGLNFPTKWISADGKSLWGVFSGVFNGFDSFNVAHVTLTTPSANPPDLPKVTLDYVATGKTYTLASAQVGTLAYIDRTYTLTGLSPALAGGRLIRTADNDKHATIADYLQFTVDRPATVSVCYSRVASELPGWLAQGGWSATSEVCSTGAAGAPDRVVYRRKVNAGLVTLGGNREAPSAGDPNYSNYLVIVGP